ncbi:hypothetical protein PI125_g4678 [Phytophthora idaei]|nr:hypothetical protein PI125_g4678 [Phytophthora idaei]KAG3166568.1 hypothetical protein PI126_g4141 [Phytophthora idaei]
MKGYDWEKLEETVRDIRENTVSERSQGTYKNSYCHFLAWVARNKPQLASSSFLERVDDTSAFNTLQQLRAGVNEVITADHTVQPLNFSAFEAKDFITWL